MQVRVPEAPQERVGNGAAPVVAPPKLRREVEGSSHLRDLIVQHLLQHLPLGVRWRLIALPHLFLGAWLRLLEMRAASKESDEREAQTVRRASSRRVT
jgi:hypothetical protein